MSSAPSLPSSLQPSGLKALCPETSEAPDPHPGHGEKGTWASGGFLLPHLPRGLRKATHRIGPTQGCGAGPLPTVAADARGRNGGRWEGSSATPTSPSPGFKAPSLHFPARLFPVSPRRQSFPPAQVYPLERDSEKSSNSLQELADEQRLRKLSTRERGHGGPPALPLPPSPPAGPAASIQPGYRRSCGSGSG